MNRHRLRERARRQFFMRDWTTRSRNLPAAKAILEVLEDSPETVLLDVGSGDLGVAAFLPAGIAVTGLDYDWPALRPDHPFLIGDIGSLPFRDRSFAAISCVDVLEHLPVTARAGAVAELVRVARTGLVVAFPSGPAAMESDARYERALTSRGKTVPSWLDEHRRAPLPEMSMVVDAVRDAAERAGRSAEIRTRFTEPLAVSNVVRRAAARSSFLYAATAIGFGVLRRVLPSPDANTAYRVMVVVRLG